MKFSFHDSIDTIPTAARLIGVEVTDAAQIARLTPPGSSLGMNIDGQHGTGSDPHYRGLAAVEIASRFSILPVDTHRIGDVALLTTRPDLDSIGAMAVLVLIGLGWTSWCTDRNGSYGQIIKVFSEFCMIRIARIAAADSFRPSAEWSAEPLPTSARPWSKPRIGPVDAQRDLAHVAAICSPRGSNERLPLAQRVAIVAAWLRDPDLEFGYVDADDVWVGQIAAACGIAFGAEDVGFALRRARTRVAAARRDLVRAIGERGAIESFVVAAPGETLCTATRRIAVIRVPQAGALGVGYCVAPVVVAFDSGATGKTTICGWAGPDGTTKYLDVPALKTRLNDLEPGWGGPSALLGSPRSGSKLTEATILAAVCACTL